MKQEENIKKYSTLAKIAFVSSLLGVVSMALFCLFVNLGMDFGIFVLLAMIFFVIATVLGILSSIIIIIYRRRLTSLVYSLLAILLSIPITGLTIGIYMTRNVNVEREKANTSLYNMKLLAKEIKKYSQNHNGYLPSAENWCDALMKENPKLTLENFRFPQPDLLGLKGKCHIAFNKTIGDKLLKDISQNTVLLFEADGGWNLNGTSDLLNKGYGEAHFVSILFVDGSESAYWFDKQAVRKFKSEFGGRASMYYEQPRWEP